jgi:hypothetical protein
MDAAARLFVTAMRRERRSYWAIMIFFFLLLAIMFAYNLIALDALSGDQRREEFRNRGEAAGSRSQLLSALNTIAYAQRNAERERQQAQRLDAMQVARRAMLAEPRTLVEEAHGYAIGHLYGRPLNMSTAAVVVAALETQGLPPAQRALLDAALFDWGLSDTLGDQDLARARPRVDQAAQILLAEPDFAPYGHAVKAGYYFRQANSGDVYMAWDNGCRELVEETEAALVFAGRVAAQLSDPQAAGLNLHYWKGQCRRRHGEPNKALTGFQEMMKLAGGEGFPETNPYKFQAVHGVAMATMGLDSSGMAPEQRTAQAVEAIEMLKQAGGYRGAAGQTESGQVSSLGNIGIITLRKQTADRYIEALEFTEKVDAITASTWNLVGRLVAARALQREGLPETFSDASMSINGASADDLRRKYTPDAVEDIVFNTFAELAWLSRDFPTAEFKRLLDEEHHPALAEAGECIGTRLACYELAAGR